MSVLLLHSQTLLSSHVLHWCSQSGVTLPTVLMWLDQTFWYGHEAIEISQISPKLESQGFKKLRSHPQSESKGQWSMLFYSSILQLQLFRKSLGTVVQHVSCFSFTMLSHLVSLQHATSWLHGTAEVPRLSFVSRRRLKQPLLVSSCNRWFRETCGSTPSWWDTLPKFPLPLVP